jgi:putative ABC transport system permease protein
MKRGTAAEEATADAFHTALIPIMNSLFAVGLVTLPGMMTGQILSGVSPLIAARYQIMVMAMIFGATGLSALLFLYLTRQRTAPSNA